MGPRKHQKPRRQFVAASKSARKTPKKRATSKSAQTNATKLANIQPRRPSRRIRGLPPEDPRTTLSSRQVALQQEEAATQKRAESSSATDTTPEPRPKLTSKSKAGFNRRQKGRKKPPPPDSSHDSAGGTTLADDPEDDLGSTGVGEGSVDEEEFQGEGEAATNPPLAAQPVYVDPTERWVMENSTAQQIAFLEGLANTLRAGFNLQSGPPISPQNAAYMRLQNQGKNGSRKGSPSKTKNGSSSTKEAGSTNSGYKSPGFRAMLEKGVRGVKLFMSEDFNEEGPEAKSKALLEKLKEESYDPSADERYKAGVLRVKLGKLAIKNERNVVHTLHDLVCPAAEDLAAVNNGDAKLRATYKLLIDLWDEPWIHAPRPLEGYAAPQPDYCVGFVRQAFSAEQWRLLDRVPGIAAATDYMHFPFLTCEAKSPKEQIFAAENQNAYNMMVTVSTTVKLFRAAKREMSVHRRVLAFSISYNSTNVSLNGYYPIIVGPRTEIYCTDILDFAISPPATWQSWHFVRNIYEVWAPEHLNHLRRAINSLKDTVKDRDEATPTPSESANLGLQQLGLQSPAPHAVQSENPSVCSNPERVKRAETEPPMGSSKRTRID